MLLLSSIQTQEGFRKGAQPLGYRVNTASNWRIAVKPDIKKALKIVAR